ncbi:hypothetical protein K445DRAFT_312866 [Daldinia sp. EC12]|nr:hypothetical protein K445DRAFT_312866 [Daldinia sp. EC12]
MGFLPFPASSINLESTLPNQPPTPAPPGSRLWGVRYIFSRDVHVSLCSIICFCALDVCSATGIRKKT